MRFLCKHYIYILCLDCSIFPSFSPLLNLNLHPFSTSCTYLRLHRNEMQGIMQHELNNHYKGPETKNNDEGLQLKPLLLAQYSDPKPYTTSVQSHILMSI